MIRHALLAGIALPALLLAGCGKQDAEEEVGTRAGSIVENAADAALVDLTAGSPIDKPFRMNNADPADLERFDALFDGAADKPFQVTESSFDENLGAIVLTGVSNTEEGRVFTIGRVELFGVNLDYLEALRAGTAVEPTQEVARKVRLFDTTLFGHPDLAFNGTLTIEAMEFDRLSLGDISVAEEEGEESRQSGFGLAGLYLKNLLLEGGEEGGSVDLTIADLRMSDVIRGRIGPVTMRGIDYSSEQGEEAQAQATAEEGLIGAAGPFSEVLANMLSPTSRRLTIDAVKWDGIDASGFIASLDSTGAPQPGEEAAVSLGQMEATDLRSYIDGREASYTEYLMLEPARLSGFIPEALRFVAHGNITDMTAYVPEDKTGMITAMREQGLDELRSSNEMTWAYAADTGKADLVYDVDMPGYGMIDLKWSMTGLTPEVMAAASEEAGWPALVSTSLANFSLEVQDRRLIEALVAVAAEELDEDPAALRKNLPAYVALGSSQIGGSVPQMEDYVASVSSFLTEGGTLKVAVSPETPVPLETVGLLVLVSPSMMPDLLGISVEHTE